MAVRLVTSAFGLVVFFLALFAGQGIFTAAICVVTLGMLVELYRTIKFKTELNITGLVCAIFVLISIICGGTFMGIALPIAVMVYLGVMVWLHNTEVTYKEVAAHSFLTLFITAFFGTLIRIYSEFGVYAVLLVFICAWTTDSGAYFTGRAIGKTKLIPKVSPKKTVEGAIGGIITAVVCSWIYLLILNSTGNGGWIGFWGITVLALVTSVCSQLGDLVASSIKRDCDVKDFGTLLPGHGGILDRFDSVIYIAPIIYYILVIAAL